MTEPRTHEDHEHIHGPTALTHGDHVDYIHDGHPHAAHDGHWDEH
jgi:hypothetical protein